MADRKITDLTALAAGSQATGDLLTIVDVSEAAATDKNKKITVESLFKGIPGNVGIGTSSPSKPLHIYSGSSDAEIRLQTNSGTEQNTFISLRESSGDLDFYTVASGTNMKFHTVNAERLRIDSSGNVGIGTSSPTTKLNVEYGALEAASLHELILNANYGTTNNGGGRIGITFSGNPDGTAGAGSKTAGVYGVSTDNTQFTRSMGLVFNTSTTDANSTERMRIDSSGNVGVGTTSPSSKLTVNGDIFASGGNIFTGANQQLSSDSAIRPLIFGIGGNEKARIDSSGLLAIGTTVQGESSADNLTLADTGNCGLTIRSGTSNGGSIYFSDATSGAAQYDGYISYNHPSQFLAFGTASAERMRIQSGGGISFNGDTAAANALDDYEEGTWTPTLNAGGTITTLSYATYTKVGRLVSIALYYTAATLGTGTSAFYIEGLPFTSRTGYGFGNIGYAATTNVSELRPLVALNANYIYFHKTDGNGAVVTHSIASTVLLLGAVYYTDT